jgi:hypothetical protein
MFIVRGTRSELEAKKGFHASRNISSSTCRLSASYTDTGRGYTLHVIRTPVGKQFISDDNKISANTTHNEKEEEKEAFPKKTKTKTKKTTQDLQCYVLNLAELGQYNDALCFVLFSCHVDGQFSYVVA